MAAPITFAGDFEVEVEFSTVLNDGNYGMLFGDTNDNNTFIGVNPSGKLRLRIQGTTYDSQIIINDGKLHLINIKLDGSVVTLLVDGVLDGNFSISTGNNTFDIIGLYSGNTHYFDGIIANAKFTDKSGASDVVTTFKLDNSPAVANYTYSTELLDNNTFPDNANARQYLVSTKGWIITDGGAA
tara:strand:- start:31 stop:582 length:552 start_codon:yes stop_codon:yes gene_type:complete